MDETLLDALEADRLTWLKNQLNDRGLNADPIEMKRTIDDIAMALGLRFIRDGWLRVAADVLSVRVAVKFVVDTVLKQGLIELPILTDPRERALHLRKHRNTGPAKAVPGARRQFGSRR